MYFYDDSSSACYQKKFFLENIGDMKYLVRNPEDESL